SRQSRRARYRSSKIRLLTTPTRRGFAPPPRLRLVTRKNPRRCRRTKSSSRRSLQSLHRQSTMCSPVGANCRKTSTEQAKSTPECPLDQVSLGRKSWSVLHTLAAYYPDKPTAPPISPTWMPFLRSFSRLFAMSALQRRVPSQHCQIPPPPVRDGRA
uniref:Sulfhydryl oxidase n=1 Tax=Macrostomum lignano TaxID=282301 RepID=A0A1I8F6T4_9PLAT